MRHSRKITLNATGLFHKMWRGHNREHVLAENTEKLDYLNQLATTRSDKTKSYVKWHSFCIMGNHVHETGSLERDSMKNGLAVAIDELGDWMRRAHSRFGAGYNRRHKRQGKVAYDRPKTCEIENHHQLLRVMFYGDANPVRAGIVSHPSRYPFSTYQFYAYGKKSSYTRSIEAPQAYLQLGATPKERQRKYRKLCDSYLREAGLIEDSGAKEMEARFIGSPVWYRSRRRDSLEVQKYARAGPVGH